jgi:SAM-dependent methyltransferase
MAGLNIGCGKRSVPGTFGVDVVALAGVDVVADFDGVALPFAADTIDKIHAYHVLEHMRELERVMEEIHRVCRNGARVVIEVPYFSCVGAFGDPTHKRFFAYETFRFWSAETDQANWFTQAHFEIKRRRLVFGRAHRMLGVEWWANRWPNIYENFFAFWFPARMLEAELIAVKGNSLR